MIFAVSLKTKKNRKHAILRKKILAWRGCGGGGDSVAYTSVTFNKVPEQHDHVYLVRSQFPVLLKPFTEPHLFHCTVGRQGYIFC